MSAYETLLTEQRGDGVLLVTLNRPTAGNALSSQMAQELLDVWSAADTRAQRAIVLTGAGERIFCAGADLKERDGMSDAQWVEQHRLFERMRDALLDLPCPVIAAVNGAAYGGGAEIALACDFAYASPNARFALTEVRLGIMPGLGGTQNLARAAGERRAREVLLTGEPFGADDALVWGVVNRVTDDVVSDALATAAKIAANAPLSVQAIRKALREGAGLPMRRAIEAELAAYDTLTPTADRREGIAAFNEKRSPRFEGR
ncbi:MAG TPA: enoyl-CoA hydratase/isomerase family protein [Caulobacteraceae bacterium]|nr:enoyl-CoA hydratase/isomerase family protein [Caulobacteraceae bacterium]